MDYCVLKKGIDMAPYTEQKQQEKSTFHDSNKIDLRNEIQAAYGSHPVPWFNWVFEAMDLPSQSRILEIGCGSGAFWQENQERIPADWRLTLTDPVTGIIQDARTRLADLENKARFLAADCQALPYPGDHFDAVLAIGVLDLLPNLDQALAEIWRVLGPSGMFLATAGGKGHLEELEARLKPFIPDDQAELLGGDESRFGLENGTQRLSTYFEEVTRRDFSDRMVFTQLQPILDYILSDEAIVWSMPLDRLGKFVHRLKRELEQNHEIGVSIRKGLFVARKKVIG